jgi:integrase
MLTIFRRHKRDCPHKSKGRAHVKCDCPLSAEGPLLYADGHTEFQREFALHTRNWEEAQRIVRTKEADALALTQPESAPKTIQQSKDAFVAHLNDTTENGGERRKLSDDTLKKYERLLEGWVKYCEKHGVVYLKDFLKKDETKDHVREFRRTWKDDPTKWSFVKKNERLQAVFTYFVTVKFIEQNPVGSVSLPARDQDEITEEKIIKPEQWQCILAACEALRNRQGQGKQIDVDRCRAFLLFLWDSGCRISDVMELDRTQVKGQSFELKANKNRKRNFGPLSAETVAALAKLPNNGPHYFWTGNGLLKSAISDIRRPLSKIFKHCNIRVNPHMFRHTRISRMLWGDGQHGMPPAEVAEMVGDTEEIIIKHYKHFMPEWRNTLIEKAKKSL